LFVGVLPEEAELEGVAVEDLGEVGPVLGIALLAINVGW